MKHKIFVFVNGGQPGLLQVVALGDDGKCIACHCSSNEYWARHDMGADGRSDWKHDAYDAHFGAGNWEIKYLENPDADPECLAAIALANSQPGS